MPNPSPVVLKGGRIVYRVQYRLIPGATPVSDRFDELKDALQYCRLIERVGGAEARRLRDASTKAEWGQTMTFAQAWEEYEAHARSYAEVGTLKKYRRIYTAYMERAFASWPISQMTRRQIEEWVSNLRTTPTARQTQPYETLLSPKSIKNIHGLLSSILRLQVERGVLERNVAKGVRLPTQAPVRHPVFLNELQRKALVEALPQQWRLFVEFMFSTGLRWGEVTALTWEDIDLYSTPATVYVTKAWKVDTAGKRIGPPKTPKSRRSVSIPDSLAQRLKAVCPPEGRGWVFKGPRGGEVKDTWFSDRIWMPAVIKAGIYPRPRIHDLRHTHASILLAQNVPINIVQARMGHESIQTTVNIYGHLVPDAGRIAAEAMQKALDATT